MVLINLDIFVKFENFFCSSVINVSKLQLSFVLIEFNFFWYVLRQPVKAISMFLGNVLLKLSCFRFMEWVQQNAQKAISGDVYSAYTVGDQLITKVYINDSYMKLPYTQKVFISTKRRCFSYQRWPVMMASITNQLLYNMLYLCHKPASTCIVLLKFMKSNSFPLP